MTKLQYIITKNGKEIPSAVYATWENAKKAVAELGNRAYSYKAIYVDYNPDLTKEGQEKMKERVQKIREKRKLTAR